MTDIEDLINNIQAGDYAKATPQINDILGTKVYDALEQEKVAIAQAMWSPEDDFEEETYEDEDMEVSDEELEAAMDDLENFDDEDEEV